MSNLPACSGNVLVTHKVHELFAHALHRTARDWRRAVDRRLKSVSVSQAGWLAITIVASATQPLSQTELADELGVEGATVVSLIDRLVQADLVARQLSDADRRVKLVVLTDSGRRLLSVVQMQAEVAREILLAGIDTEELLATTVLLERIRKTVAAELSDYSVRRQSPTPE